MENNGLNPWSNGKRIHIKVTDFEDWTEPQDVTWKGKTIHVWDYPLFVSIVKNTMESQGQTKNQVLDDWFFTMDGEKIPL